MSEESDEKPPAPADNRAFLAWLETVPDPERRYNIATSTLEEYQELVRHLSALRASAVAAASEDDSVTSVARRFGVSRQRAHQLLKEARSKEAAPPSGARRKGRKS